MKFGRVWKEEWCSVVWCGVVWCGVMWCGKEKQCKRKEKVYTSNVSDDMARPMDGRGLE